MAYVPSASFLAVLRYKLIVAIVVFIVNLIQVGGTSISLQIANLVHLLNFSKYIKLNNYNACIFLIFSKLHQSVDGSAVAGVCISRPALSNIP